MWQYLTPAAVAIYIKQNRGEAFFYLAMLVFSTWLMFHTFSYDYEKSHILIGGFLWSDFGANLPLIRSFSMGDNWPPEYPIFAGLPIQYHYFFFLIVGLLERAGLPLHWALNLPSTFGLFLILSMTYLIGKRLFADARIGVLAVIFFLFNGSLGFVQYFATHPLVFDTLTNIFTLREFIAPQGGEAVLPYWNWSTLINQRHFCLSLGLVLSFLFACLVLANKTPKLRLYWAIFFGVIIGFFPVLHKPMLMVLAVVMIVYFIALPNLRIFLFTTGVVSIAVMGILWFFSFNIAGGPVKAVEWYPGFSIHNSLNFISALKFFWYQFGLHAILIPIGFWMAPRKAKIFIIPAVIMFAITFTFKFSDEVMAGHKFFNFFLVVAQMLSALVVVRIFDYIIQRARKPMSPGKISQRRIMVPLEIQNLPRFKMQRNSLSRIQSSKNLTKYRKGQNTVGFLQLPLDLLGKRESFWERGISMKFAKSLAFIITGTIIFFSTLSGMLDAFPVINIGLNATPDINANPDARWYYENTKGNDVVLTTGFLYSAPNIAGRKIFEGWPYFTWSAGYDDGPRRKIKAQILGGGDTQQMCTLLRENNLSYVEVEKVINNNDIGFVNVEFFRKHFKPEYMARQGDFAIYSTKKMCDVLN